MIWTLIPAKPFALAKQRLSPRLSAAQRAVLARDMLKRTIHVAREAAGGDPVAVVTHDPAVAMVARSSGALCMASEGCEGLNAELQHAAASLPATDAVLVLHADLPLLAAGDLTAIRASNIPFTIAPDHARCGTNALLQRHASRIFAFGENSFERHCAHAARLGLHIAEIVRMGLTHDLDEPHQLSWLAEPPCLPAGYFHKPWRPTDRPPLVP